MIRVTSSQNASSRTGRRLAVAAVVAALALAGCSAGGSPSPSPSGNVAEQLAAKSLPSWLPTPSAGGQAVGTAKDPAMSYQGVPVLIKLDRGDALTMNVVGPTAPPGTKVGAEKADLTWTVTVSDATATIPLSLAQFNVQDESGAYHGVTASDGGTIPASIKPGETVTFAVHTVAASGEGMVRWAPDGNRVVALWDYVAELD